MIVPAYPTVIDGSTIIIFGPLLTIAYTQAQIKIFDGLDNKQKDFLEFVLSKYIETGVEELDQKKLPDLLTLKYQALSDAEEILGGVDSIRETFIGFQKYLYEPNLKG